MSIASRHGPQRTMDSIKNAFQSAVNPKPDTEAEKAGLPTAGRDSDRALGSSMQSGTEVGAKPRDVSKVRGGIRETSAVACRAGVRVQRGWGWLGAPPAQSRCARPSNPCRLSLPQDTPTKMLHAVVGRDIANTGGGARVPANVDPATVPDQYPPPRNLGGGDNLS
jgi:hypothetical protein